jgi:glycosyltransferase involved in cell wall biosynthesis
MQVSIVLPCFNAAPHLERCLSSLFAQTHRPLELIAVDDGSRDDTLVLLEEARARCPFRMTVLRQPNAGACSARNAGLLAASGTFIQFMDADDELEPSKIMHQAAIASRAGARSIVCGRSLFIDGGSQREERLFDAADHDPWLALMRHRLGRTSALLFPRSLLVEAGGWNVDARSSQEYELLFTLLKHGAAIVHDNAPLTTIHKSAGSISLSNESAFWSRFVGLRRRVLAHVASQRRGTDLRPYEQSLFDAIRTLHSRDAEAAERLYAECFPRGFVPERSEATGAAYAALHRLLGFRLANRLARAIRSAASPASRSAD